MFCTRQALKIAKGKENGFLVGFASVLEQLRRFDSC
jgi:hypothetical protein